MPPFTLIEIGSNQVTLLVGQHHQGRLHILHEASATLRLKGELSAAGELPANALHGLLKQLQVWQPLWHKCPPQQRQIISTQVLREARNSAQWVQALEQSMHCKVHIIDGQQEAAWGYAGAMLQADGVDLAAPTLVLDIGGGSTEVSYGHGTQWQAGQSFGVGAVSWSQRYFTQGLTAAAFEEAIAQAHSAMTALHNSEWQQPWGHTYAIAGVAQALGHVLHQLGEPAGTIRSAALWNLEQRLCHEGLTWLHIQCDLPAKLEPVLGGCISTMRAAMQALGVPQLQVSAGGLRHGALHALCQASSLAQRL